MKCLPILNEAIGLSGDNVLTHEKLSDILERISNNELKNGLDLNDSARRQAFFQYKSVWSCGKETSFYGLSEERNLDALTLKISKSLDSEENVDKLVWEVLTHELRQGPEFDLVCGQRITRSALYFLIRYHLYDPAYDNDFDYSKAKLSRAKLEAMNALEDRESHVEDVLKSYVSLTKFVATQTRLNAGPEQTKLNLYGALVMCFAHLYVRLVSINEIMKSELKGYPTKEDEDACFQYYKSLIGRKYCDIERFKEQFECQGCIAVIEAIEKAEENSGVKLLSKLIQQLNGSWSVDAISLLDFFVRRMLHRESDPYWGIDGNVNRSANNSVNVWAQINKKGGPLNVRFSFPKNAKALKMANDVKEDKTGKNIFKLLEVGPTSKHIELNTGCGEEIILNSRNNSDRELIDTHFSLPLASWIKDELNLKFWGEYQ